jgi:uncharacterized protein (TIGR04255 family)
LRDDKPTVRLPHYESPPVVETALAIEFAPVAGWNLVHFGAIWERFRDTYPGTEVIPGVQFSPELEITNPPIRFFFTNEDGTQLVQLRSGAFIRNWRAQPDNEQYPRYETIRPSFERDLRVFLEYLTANGFAKPEVWKCEVTYVNHFLRGREWADVADLYKILPMLSSGVHTELLANPTQLRFAINYELADDFGNLLIQLVPGLRADGKELLQLTLTAYGKPKGSELPQLLEWLDQGHYAVVQGFSDFTSEDIQTKMWGRIWP